MSGRRTRSWIALALTLAVPAQAFAATPNGVASTIPNGQTNDPVQRGALLALGSVYRVETTVTVGALRTKSGQVYPLGNVRTITELGTAYAVAPTGVLVTDAHVAAPSGAPLAVAAAPLALAQKGIFGREDAYVNWVNSTKALPIDVHVLRVRVWRATASASTTPTKVAAAIIPKSVEPAQDLALLQISDRTVPALKLDTSETTGTPIAAVGYGVATATTLGLPTTVVPGIKPGQIDVTGRIVWLPGQSLTQIDANIALGDSGGPVVGSNGDTHGIVRFIDPGTPIPSGLMDQASTIYELLARLHITNSAGPIAASFRVGMNDLWTNDLAGANTALTATVHADPTHPLAAQELALVMQLQHSAPRPVPSHWLRALFLGLATLAGLAAAACVVRLRQVRRMRRGPNDATPQFPAAH